VKYGQHGQDVTEVQQALIDEGFRLPKYGADGHLGDETWDALERYAKAECNGWSPSVPQNVIDSLHEQPAPPAPMPTPPPPDSGVAIVDLRHEQSQPAPKSKVANGATVLRTPHTVTGICIHQTACTYGVSQNQINAAGGDRALALHRRALNVACHAMAFMDGSLVLTNEMESYIYHGNGLNSFTLGLEVEGRYPGLVNDPENTTWGGDPTPLTEQTIRAAREGVRQLVQLGNDAGMPVTHIYTHRQSSETRRSDCGEGLWRAVVTDYAVAKLGLIIAPAFTVGSGEPVPQEWDAAGVGRY